MAVTCTHFTDWNLPGKSVQPYLKGQNGICEAVQAMYVAGGYKSSSIVQLYVYTTDWVQTLRIALPSAFGRSTQAATLPFFVSQNGPRTTSGMMLLRKRTSIWPHRRNVAGSETLPGCNSGRLGTTLLSVWTTFTTLQSFLLKTTRRREDGDFSPTRPEFLLANMRTVSFGTKIGHPSEAKHHQGCLELSAWYGRSGPMVCAEKDGSSVIIGMVQGGTKDSDCNLILLFNTEMRDWLQAATDLRESLNTHAIRRCVVVVH
ncbi:uncharacterized protein Z519_09083 [Cladophialophora bantiana CBS 173.52]|uniref:Uncharacterized protein n=1 Tax=Cladophialophora bantiana (strain ATCC 10958 / CBS 173.52 / CDC B-1940 / NIH 8579) TaxID=1442370 RepID=A0A0D2FV68_CLAB1|nr:uncharacterized protein Z519_09083 [Cladophialophora bantiana CBS 173.52]KIW90437.1 hypothetical protein Z519_09083 [Cladophialophora bantiana CBS 173.52]